MLMERRYNKLYDNAEPAEVIEWIIRKLNSWGAITIIDDKYAGETLRLYSAKTDEKLLEIADLGLDELIAKSRTGGVDWFNRVFANPGFWSDLRENPPTDDITDTSAQRTADEIIPASDRIVTRSDNRVQIDVIQADMRGLTEEIDASNEASIELGDEKELIRGELAAADIILERPVFRLSRLTSLVLPALQFLAEKFATGAIGEMAKRIILAIFGLN